MKRLNLEIVNAKSQYQIVYINDTTYNFVTDQGIQYRIGFLDDESMTTCETFQFYIQKLTPFPSIKDEKIKPTIIAVIENFFEENASVLLYMCDTSDGRQQLRSRLFLRWFNTNAMKNKYLCKDTSIVVDDIPMYAGIIVRRDNPLLSDIEHEFDETARILSEK